MITEVKVLLGVDVDYTDAEEVLLERELREILYEYYGDEISLQGFEVVSELDEAKADAMIETQQSKLDRYRKALEDIAAESRHPTRGTSYACQLASETINSS